MGILDYVIIALVAVWFAIAVRSIVKRGGGCSCGASGGCPKDCASCASCASCANCRAHAGKKRKKVREKRHVD